jgi:hypothetical protein
MNIQAQQQTITKPKKKEKKEEKTSLPRSLEMSWWWWWWWWGHVLLAWVGLFWVLWDLYESCVSFASALLRPILLFASSLQCCCN